jgi:hypothetical protein
VNLRFSPVSFAAVCCNSGMDSGRSRRQTFFARAGTHVVGCIFSRVTSLKVPGGQDRQQQAAGSRVREARRRRLS